MNFLTVEDTFAYIDDLPNGYLLEFGVYNGNTLSRLIKRGNFEWATGFDSFQGLPANTEGNPDWPEGAFNSVKDTGFSSAQQIMDYIYKKIDFENLILIEGFFDKTLTPEAGVIYKDKASYIHLDCDLFSSTKTCLDWILKYRVAKPGCLFRYDDWYGYSNCGGQRAAHQLCSHKYNANFDSVADNVFIFRGFN